MRWLVPVCAAAVLLGGCGSDQAAVSPSDFARRLVSRERITLAEARCVADYVFAEVPSDVIAEIYHDGLQSAPVTSWDFYGHSMVACSFADDLGIGLGRRGHP